MPERCAACKSTLLEALAPVFDPFTRRSFGLAGCRECGTRQVTGVTEAEIPSFYPKGYYAHVDGEDGALTRLRNRLVTARTRARPTDRILRLAMAGLVPGVPPVAPHAGARLLDAGCGTGERTVPFRSLGWDLHGTELDPVAAARAAEHGLVMHEPDLRDVADRSFACVRLWHSLEHFLDPGAILDECRRVLLPSGMLIIGIPNSSGLPARMFGVQWHHFDAPRHLVHFTRTGLERLLEATRFDITFLATYGDRGVVGSIERIAIATGREVAIKDRLPLVLLEMPFNLLLRWTGAGDLLEIHASPN